MRSIFVCNHEKDIARVYAPELAARVAERRVWSGDEIRAHRGEFADVDFIFSTWGMPAFTEEEIREIFPALQCVFYAAGTVQAFARPFLNVGVKVFSAWAANAVPVAEYTVSQILLANKNFFTACRLNSTGDRKAAASFAGKCHGNYGDSVGIIGAGMIGKLVIGMLKEHNLCVMTFDPFLPDEKAKELGVTKCSLEKLFSSCQIVSNHLANNEQTKGMLTYSLFASMPEYATFINTGRGAQVIEDDLAKALSERPDLTAILDVTFPEPPAQDHPFYSLPNCFLTPHIAGSMGDEVHRMAEYMEEEYQNYTKGKPTRYEVSLKMLDTMA